MNWICKLGFHDWYVGSYITGLVSKFTGDHIGRSERRCINCDRKEIFIGQFSKEFQEMVWKKLNLPKKPKHIAYEDGDWLDIETKIRLAENTIDKEKLIKELRAGKMRVV